MKISIHHWRIGVVRLHGFQVNEYVLPMVTAANGTSQIDYAFSLSIEEQRQVSSDEHAPFFASKSEMHHPVTLLNN